MTRITTTTLDCGMPLIVEQIPGVESVGLSWFLPSGSARDPGDRLGLSAMYAELLLRGCAGMSSREHADALDRVGVGRSVDVGTHYLAVSASALGSRLGEALPLLVDMVRRPTMDASAIDPVRDLCLQSIDALADDPHERASIAARERHAPPPLNRSGLGTKEGLTRITHDDLVSGWAERSRPGGAILAIAGAADPDELAASFNKLLAGWEGEAAPIEVGTPEHKGTYHHIEDDSAQVQILVTHDAPPEPEPTCVLERLVINVLSGGMSSRLFTEVREKRGLCYAVSAGYATDRAHGRVRAYVGTTPERAQESLDVLLAELERINSAEGRIEADEFERAAIGIKSSLVLSGESTGARASALATDMHRLGRPRSLDELAAAFDATTLDDVNNYLSQRSLGPRTIVTLGPTALTPPA